MYVDYSGITEPEPQPEPETAPEVIVTAEMKRAAKRILIGTAVLITAAAGICIIYQLGYADKWQARMRGDAYYDYWRYSTGHMSEDERITYGTDTETGERKPRMVMW